VAEFELARPHILGAVLDAAAHGLRMLPHVRLKRLPSMADFALWATACESAFRPPGTLEAAYSNNRRAAIENFVDADPVAALVRGDHDRQSAMEGKRIRSFADRRQPVWLAQESTHTRWPAAPSAELPTDSITSSAPSAASATREMARVQTILGPDWNRRFKCRRC
jgi:hypothetical protein